MISTQQLTELDLTSQDSITYITPVLEPEITLADTQAAMNMLVKPGGTPSVIGSYYNAVCSIQCSVDVNMQRALILRKYWNSPLPVNRDVLRAELGHPMETIINTLYEIERLIPLGIVHMNTGTSFEDQAAWRLSMRGAIAGMGMKTISFALHLYNPVGCKILALDRWHIRRLAERCGFKANKETLTLKQYLCVEEELLDDCSKLAEQEPGYWRVTYAAYFWELTRKAWYASHPSPLHKLADGYQDHSGLCVYS